MDSFGWVWAGGTLVVTAKEKGEREGRAKVDRMEAAAIRSRRWKERRKLDAYF